MNSPVTVRVCRADYADPLHAAALVSVLDAYAQDPMGGGEALSDFAKAHLVAALSARPQATAYWLSRRRKVMHWSDPLAW